MNSGSGIRVCRWSPDGTKIATAGDDERTTLWDVNNMEELWYMLQTFYICKSNLDFNWFVILYMHIMSYI